VNTKYGLRGTVVPGQRFKTTVEAFAYEGFELEIKDGEIAIGFNDKADEDRARDIVRQHLESFNLDHGIRCTADLNRSWEVRLDNTEVFEITVADTVKLLILESQVTKATIEGTACIVSEGVDTAKLGNYSPLVRKAQQDVHLANALTYFSEEIVDDDRPLYGIYKLMEELVYAAGGRDKLAHLANRLEKYVEDVMQTTQTTRHARTKARQLLSSEECRERARMLIKAYADAIVPCQSLNSSKKDSIKS
jgi:hypothetical protein